VVHPSIQSILVKLLTLNIAQHCRSSDELAIHKLWLVVVGCIRVCGRNLAIIVVESDAEWTAGVNVKALSLENLITLRRSM
jgi:hypothetical protein